MGEGKKSVFTFDDVMAVKDKSVSLDITKQYSALDFWESSAEYFCKSHAKREQFQANVGWLLQKLELLKPKSILDVGCGFGRTMTFVHDGLKENAPETVVGVDFCQKMIEFASEYLKEYPHKEKIKIAMVDARSLPYKDDQFELLYTDSLFTHLKFSDAQKVANEMKRVANKYIITIERFVFDGEHPEPHVFSWDINKFFRLRVLERKFIGQGIVGTVLAKDEGMS